MSPTLKRIGSYRFFIYSNEGSEPPHVHVQEGKKVAKFWLGSIEIAYSRNFAPHELNKIEKLVEINRDYFLEKWYESQK